MIIYLAAISHNAREPFRRSETAATERMMRRYPRIDGPAVLPLFCLAPHGVFPASRIAPRAVSSYLAFSTLPALRCQRTGGVFSVTLSVSARLGERRPRVLRGMLPYGVRTFLSESLRSDHLPSRRVYHSSENFAAKPFDHRLGVSIVNSPDQPEPETLYGTRSWHQGPRFFTRNQNGRRPEADQAER